MTFLKTFINSLVVVIVRYHDSQVASKLVQGPDLMASSIIKANKILESPDYLGELNALKNTIELKQKDYNTRAHFIEYLIALIVFLKQFADSPTPFTDEKLTQYASLVTQIFIDLAKLLMTEKGKQYMVTYPSIEVDVPQKVALQGLTNDEYFGNEFCNSGVFLKQSINIPFDLQVGHSLEHVQSKAYRMCLDHQNNKLVPKLKLKQVEDEAEILRLKLQIKDFELRIEKLTSQVTSSTSDIDHLKEQLRTAEQHLSAKESANTLQIIEIERLKGKLFAQNSVFGNHNGVFFARNFFAAASQQQTIALGSSLGDENAGNDLTQQESVFSLKNSQSGDE